MRTIPGWFVLFSKLNEKSFTRVSKIAIWEMSKIGSVRWWWLYIWLCLCCFFFLRWCAIWRKCIQHICVTCWFRTKNKLAELYYVFLMIKRKQGMLIRILTVYFDITIISLATQVGLKKKKSLPLFNTPQQVTRRWFLRHYSIKMATCQIQ